MKRGYPKIGDRIKHCREMRKISQDRLALLADVSPTYVSHIETGKAAPSLAILIRIMNALGVSADELLFDYVGNCRYVLNDRIASSLAACSDEQLRIITDVVETLSKSLQENPPKIF